MSIIDLKTTIPQGFDSPTSLPIDDEQNSEWQDANRSWWQSHPMRYDFTDKVKAEEFSPEFYQEIDDRFYADVKTFMPWKRIPFDPLIDFESLGNKQVLEIGVGNGSHAQLLSQFAQGYTGIDITDYAVQSTTRRLALAQNGSSKAVSIQQMDAEKMAFPAESFDFVWSWGVIHHSANTRKILEEIYRVLRPNGSATIMVYHRSFWSYYVFAGLFGGVFRGRIPTRRTLHRTRQELIDGAIARYYTQSEWRQITADLFEASTIRIYGSKTELLPIPAGSAKELLKKIIPDSGARLLTNQGGFGMFLVSTLKKRQP